VKGEVVQDSALLELQTFILSKQGCALG